MTDIHLDAIIVGGGIAGLWTLATLIESGYNAILLEKDKLGSKQTLASQGIIHGGSKYALRGKISNATQTISDMPQRWLDAYEDKGLIKLGNATLLSKSQYLVPDQGIDAKLLSFLGSKTMSSHTNSIEPDQLPKAMQNAGINNACFQLNETVFDTKSIIQCFLDQYGQYIFKGEVSSSNYEETDDQVILKIDSQTLRCSKLVLACGEGYENLKMNKPVMQKRALQMVYAKGTSLPEIFVHFIGRSTKPLLTITSHRLEDSDEIVWNMGGNLAEDGVKQSSEDLIETAKSTLTKLLPNIKLTDIDFSTLAINRAEQKQNKLTRPDDAFIVSNNHIICGWPTKLALAPRFSDKVMQEINVKPAPKTEALPILLAKAEIGDFPWQ